MNRGATSTGTAGGPLTSGPGGGGGAVVAVVVVVVLGADVVVVVVGGGSPTTCTEADAVSAPSTSVSRRGSEVSTAVAVASPGSSSLAT